MKKLYVLHDNSNRHVEVFRSGAERMKWIRSLNGEYDAEDGGYYIPVIGYTMYPAEDEYKEEDM